MKKLCKVAFAPASKEVVVEEGTTVLDAARLANVYIESHCGGKGTCGKCKIRVIDGLPEPAVPKDKASEAQSGLQSLYQLACTTRVEKDVSVFIAGENMLTAKATAKLFSGISQKLNPAVTSVCLKLPPKKDREPGAYLEEIVKLINAKFGTADLEIDLQVLKRMDPTFKKDKITVFIWMNREIIGVRPGWDETCLGLALDIGTTTLALYVCDLKTGAIVASGSITNPQIVFGADIMSRIGYSIDHPHSGVQQMQAELINALNALLERMTAQIGFSRDRIMDMTVVGNTVMHHIFLGIVLDDLGRWPFRPSIQGSLDIKARKFGILINPCAYVHVLPIEASFIGADNVGVLLSEEPYNQEELSLIMDLGTNGEIVLGNKDTLLACSCATGPALEGAHIVCGMRASKGAIEKVRIDPASLEVSYTVIGAADPNGNDTSAVKPAGICGSGIIDVVAHLFKTGLIGEDGAFSQTITTPRLRKGPTGLMEFVLVWKDATAIGEDIVLTQKDIRQIQLAKAALHAGCKVLMDRLKISTINKLVIAGAFGMHIDKENALAIGLFPWCKPENIILAGNAAGHGAYLTLVNKEKRKEAETVAKTVTHIELALEKDFQKEFLNALAIPCKS